LVITPSSITKTQSVKIQAQIKNIGSMKGAEIVQLYVNDPIASIVRYNKQLNGFHRIELNPGETQTVTFILPAKQLAFYNSQMKLVVEPGQFNVLSF
jgi:beta-glucosidase